MTNLLICSFFQPFEFLDSYQYLQRTTPPPIDHFHSKLKGVSASLEDYNFFLKLWNFFKISNYHQIFFIYSCLDSCSLADVIHFYYGYLYKVCNLYPSYYITGASYSLNSFLLNGKDPKNPSKPIKLELLDSEIHYLFSQSLLGGFSISSSTYAFFTGFNVKDNLENKEQRQCIYSDANRQVVISVVT